MSDDQNKSAPENTPEEESPELEENDDSTPIYKKKWFIITIIVVIVCVLGLIGYICVRNKQKSENERRQQQMCQQQMYQQRQQAIENAKMQAEEAARLKREQKRQKKIDEENKKLQAAEDRIRDAFRKELEVIGQEIAPEQRKQMIEARNVIVDDVIMNRMHHAEMFADAINSEFEKYKFERAREEAENELTRINNRNAIKNDASVLDWEKADKLRQLDKQYIERMIDNEINRLRAIQMVSPEVAEDLSDDED